VFIVTLDIDRPFFFFPSRQGSNAYQQQQPDLFAQQTPFNMQQPQPTGGWPLVDTSFGQGSQFNVRSSSSGPWLAFCSES
jgi:hypothetical protein